jgi:hypothetical protein
MRTISLPEIVELAQLSLERPGSTDWLKGQLQEVKPHNSVAKGALEFLAENNFDGLLLLSILQQTPAKANLNKGGLMEFQEKRQGLGRSLILALGLICLALTVFLYLRFAHGILG